MKVELSKLISRIAVAGFVAVAVRYGGAKPAGTNAPPDDVSSPTNSPTMMCFSPRPMMLPPPEPTTNHQQPTNQIPNWTARGAYCDWERIDFCDGFRFPIGTNFIDGVTLFAYGEVRIKRGSAVSALVEDGSSASSTSGEDAASPLSGAPSTFIYSLPSRVSLEPNASSVSHGLTPSNSYLFAWHNCCVERCATNRVDASIELFRSGAMATRLRLQRRRPTDYQLPSTNYQLYRRAGSASAKTKTGSARPSPTRRTRSLWRSTTVGSSTLGRASTRRTAIASCGHQ